MDRASSCLGLMHSLKAYSYRELGTRHPETILKSVCIKMIACLEES